MCIQTQQRYICHGGSVHEHKLPAALLYESPSAREKPCDYSLSMATCRISLLTTHVTEVCFRCDT